jgi:hypothetical protein
MVDTASTMLVPTRTASVDFNMFDTAALRAQIKVEKVEKAEERSAGVNCRYVPW